MKQQSSMMSLLIPVRYTFQYINGVKSVKCHYKEVELGRGCWIKIYIKKLESRMKID